MRKRPQATARSAASTTTPRTAIHGVPLLIDPTDGCELVRVVDAARLMALRVRVIYTWIQQGKVRTRRTASGRLYVEVGSLWQREAAAQEASR